MVPEELSFQLMDPLGRTHGQEAGFVLSLLQSPQSLRKGPKKKTSIDTAVI